LKINQSLGTATSDSVLSLKMSPYNGNVGSEIVGVSPASTKSRIITFQIDKATDTLSVVKQTDTTAGPTTFTTVDGYAGRYQTSDGGATFNNVEDGNPIIILQAYAAYPVSFAHICLGTTLGRRISTAF